MAFSVTYQYQYPRATGALQLQFAVQKSKHVSAVTRFFGNHNHTPHHHLYTDNQKHIATQPTIHHVRTLSLYRSPTPLCTTRLHREWHANWGSKFQRQYHGHVRGLVRCLAAPSCKCTVLPA